MNEGTLLFCPNCTADGHYTAFGSITPHGEIVISRKFNRKTVIVTSEFMIICDCGYSIKYKEGKVSSGQQATDYPYEETI